MLLHQFIVVEVALECIDFSYPFKAVMAICFFYMKQYNPRTKSKIKQIAFEDFKGQVIAYLPGDQQKEYDDLSAWNVHERLSLLWQAFYVGVF